MKSVQTTYPFSKERRFQSQQRKKENDLLLFFACLVELRKGENFHSLSETLIGRERVNMGVGSTNETKNFLVFIIRKALFSKRAHTQTLTFEVGTTFALRREHEKEFSY